MHNASYPSGSSNAGKVPPSAFGPQRAFMKPDAEDVNEWIAQTRIAQGLSGIVTLDPGLHSRTVAAVKRNEQQKREQMPQGA